MTVSNTVLAFNVNVYKRNSHVIIINFGAFKTTFTDPLKNYIIISLEILIFADSYQFRKI